MTITVIGLPGPQGSKRFVGHAKSGRGIMIESSGKVKPWREAVKHAGLEYRFARPEMRGMDGPLSVAMTFTLPRPKSAKRGAMPSKRPDLSKLVRSTEDALTDSGIWRDDALVVECRAAKRYPCEGTDALDVPGCVIRIGRVS